MLVLFRSEHLVDQCPSVCKNQSEVLFTTIVKNDNSFVSVDGKAETVNMIVQNTLYYYSLPSFLIMVCSGTLHQHHLVSFLEQFPFTTFL